MRWIPWQAAQVGAHKLQWGFAKHFKEHSIATFRNAFFSGLAIAALALAVSVAARPQLNSAAGSPDYASDPYYEPYEPGNDHGQGSGCVADGRGGSVGPERFDRDNPELAGNEASEGLGRQRLGPRRRGGQTFSFFDQGTGFGSPGFFGGDIRSFGGRAPGAESGGGCGVEGNLADRRTFSFFDQGTGFGSPGFFGGDTRSFENQATGAGQQPRLR